MSDGPTGRPPYGMSNRFGVSTKKSNKSNIGARVVMVVMMAVCGDMAAGVSSFLVRSSLAGERRAYCSNIRVVWDAEVNDAMPARHALYCNYNEYTPSPPPPHLPSK